MDLNSLCHSCLEGTIVNGTCDQCGYSGENDQDNSVCLPKGTILNDKYVVGSVLGIGGFGITYKAMDYNLGIKYAIKEFFPEGLCIRQNDNISIQKFSGSAGDDYDYGLESFVREGETMALFNKISSIVKIHNYFHENGTAYIAMEYLEGETLKSYLKKLPDEKMQWNDVKEFIKPVIQALKVVHNHGIIHRDIAPDNIFITSNGEIKVLDFGAARQALGDKSKSLSVILKQGYAPPEQYTSRGKQKAWTDIYALAATMYKMLTGQTPPEAMERMTGESMDTPIEMGAVISVSVNNTIMKALECEYQKRQPSIDEFELELFENDGEIDIKAIKKAIRKKKMKKRIILFSSVAAGLIAIGLVVYFSFSSPNDITVLSRVEIPPVVVSDFDNEQFEKIIRECLNKPNGDLYEHELSEITHLTIYGDEYYSINNKQEWNLDYWRDHIYYIDGEKHSGSGNFSNLNDIDKLPNLTALDVRFNSVSDLTPIIEHGNIKFLNLASNKITDISALSEINGLISVNVSGNPLPLGSTTLSTTKDMMDKKTVIINQRYNDRLIAANRNHFIALVDDGTVAVHSSVKDNLKHPKYKIADWTNIVSVDNGLNHTVGLMENGIALAVGSNEKYGQCNVQEWKDIVEIVCGGAISVGLKEDGTVTAIGSNSGRVDIWNWQDIVSLDAYDQVVVGVKSDGTIESTYWFGNLKYQNYISQREYEWENIVDVAVGARHTVGLKNDGTVLAVGKNSAKQCEVSEWTDIVDLAAGELHTIGLKSDGTVLATGWIKGGRCDVSDWTDIIDVDASSDYTIGLKADGTILVAGNSYLETEIVDWNINKPSSITTNEATKLEEDVQ